MKPFNYMGILLGILMIFIGIVGCTYTYIIDHRSYDNLAQCCKASFNTAYAEDGHIEGANLTLIQYRYTGDKPNPITSIIIDGIDYPVEASVKQTMPTYDFSKPFSNNTLKTCNKFFIQIPLVALSKMAKTSHEIFIKFGYINGATYSLPLSDEQTVDWQMQLTPVQE